MILYGLIIFCFVWIFGCAYKFSKIERKIEKEEQTETTQEVQYVFEAEEDARSAMEDISTFYGL